MPLFDVSPDKQSLADMQRGFGAALLDNRLPVPAGLVGPDGKPSTRRFAVYRNNVMVGLIDALSDAFPTVRQLVGDAFFRAMAGVYARLEPPSSPVLLHYGAGFPDFLTNFPPLKDLPFLPDIARIERAWVEAYHAADAVCADVEPLLHMSPNQIGAHCVRFHPSARLQCSAYPAFSIWQANQPGQTALVPDMAVAEDCLIMRPVTEVSIRRLLPGVAPFLQKLIDGASLSNAATAGFLATPHFDFAKALSDLLLSGALIGWRSFPNPIAGSRP